MKVLKIVYKYAFKNVVKIKLERFKRESNESLGLKNTLFEIKNSLNGVRTYRWKREELMNLKTYKENMQTET